MKVTIQVPQEFIDSILSNRVLKDVPPTYKELAIRDLFEEYVKTMIGPSDWIHEGVCQWLDNNSDDVEEVLYGSSPQ